MIKPADRSNSRSKNPTPNNNRTLKSESLEK